MLKKLILIKIIIFCLQLNISAKIYKGAEYRTKESFTYGRFEVNYIPANREAVISSFFTYHDSGPEWNEIDIEFNGRYSENIQFNSITPGQRFHIRKNYVEFDPYLDFHTYAFEWTPDYIAWFIDDKEVYRQTRDFVQTMQYEQKIMMNIWNPIYTNWVGYWNANALPAFAYYDWVSYSSYTPNNGNTGSNNNFTFQWKDEFNEFDSTRWQMAEHTFGGNQCDFYPGNIVFKDGLMVLCLTDETNTGFTDNASPEVLWARAHYDGTIKVMFSEELDQVSAQNPVNYLISGVTVKEAILSENGKSVLLKTQNYDITTLHTVVVMNVKDDSEKGNTIALKATAINNPVDFTYPLKINIGGDAWNDYLSDQEWRPDSEYGFLEGDVRNWPASIEISGTDEDDIFRSERKGLTTYKIRVPNGIYEINLMFAENDNNNPGDRVFEVIAEDSLISGSIDISALAGKSNLYTLNFTSIVEDEIIDIYFPELVDSAFINAIKIEQISTGINSQSSVKPSSFELMQNYPNPFNGITNIRIAVHANENYSYTIYNLLGQLVYHKNLGLLNPGIHNISWQADGSNSKNFNSGIYFLSVNNPTNNKTIKMVYLK